MDWKAIRDTWVMWRLLGYLVASICYIPYFMLLVSSEVIFDVSRVKELCVAHI